MHIVIAGLGSIGRRHLRNIRALEPAAIITVLRRDASSEKPALADRLVTSLDEALRGSPDAAFICGPTSAHAPYALRFAQAGVHVFVEKPITDELASARELVATMERNGRLLMVGYNLRFDYALQAVHEFVQHGRIGRIMTVHAEVGYYLPDWRPGTDYRRSPTARAALGGGVTLELSHELDYVRWLCGDVVDLHAFSGRLSDLDVDVEDTAEILLAFAGGAIGTVHLDMTQHARTRTLRLVGTAGTIAWDGLAGTARYFSAATRDWQQIDVKRSDGNATYRDEVAHFLACIRTGTPPRISGADGVRTLELALQARSGAFRSGIAAR